MLTNSKQFWSQAWSRHFDAYAQNQGRQAYYLRFLLQADEQSLLEIGAGSFRDTVQLNKWGYDCLGTDFSDDAVERARQFFPAFADRIQCMDAMALDLPDDAVDVSFHNGFWILFEEDHTIDQFLAEQIRVTRKRVVCTVQNALHKRRVEQFRSMKEQDDIYDIRFYEPDEIRAVLEKECKRVELYPYGNPMIDRCINRLGRLAPLNFMYRRLQQQDIQHTERIMAVGYLD